jgi:predicted nucleic acid-binding protein
MLDRLALLDSSVVINVIATRQAPEILRALRGGVGICTAVGAEVLFLRSGSPSDPPERISLDPLIGDRLLMRVGLEHEAEKAAYVDLAADLEDGEAMTIAIAAVRGFAVATDDRKARRIAAQRYGNSLVLVRTTEILRAWVLDACVDDATVRTVLNRIETIARFRPANDDPLRDWWDQAVSSRLD